MDMGAEALTIFGLFGMTEGRAVTRFRYEGEILGRDGNGGVSWGFLILGRDGNGGVSWGFLTRYRPIALKRDGDPRDGLRQQGSALRRDFMARLKSCPDTFPLRW
jgi:hypothetical protein